MKTEKLRLGIILYVIGIVGVLSILTMEIDIPADAKAILLEEFTEGQIKWLTLVNPTFLLLIALFLGVNLHDKVGLDVPIIKGWINKQNNYDLSSIVKLGVVGGIVSGIIITLVALVSQSILPQEFIELGEKVKPSIAARFLYGGITEEILLRFGLMTLIVWVLFKISKKLTSNTYWLAIILSALIFGLGHFPVAFQALGNPSVFMLTYILIANALGGVVFGWVYWKKGLESAFIAHAVTHAVFLVVELF